MQNNDVILGLPNSRTVLLTADIPFLILLIMTASSAFMRVIDDRTAKSGFFIKSTICLMAVFISSCERFIWQLNVSRLQQFVRHSKTPVGNLEIPITLRCCAMWSWMDQKTSR